MSTVTHVSIIWNNHSSLMQPFGRTGVVYLSDTHAHLIRIIFHSHPTLRRLWHYQGVQLESWKEWYSLKNHHVIVANVDDNTYEHQVGSGKTYICRGPGLGFEVHGNHMPHSHPVTYWHPSEASSPRVYMFWSLEMSAVRTSSCF